MAAAAAALQKEQVFDAGSISPLMRLHVKVFERVIKNARALASTRLALPRPRLLGPAGGPRPRWVGGAASARARISCWVVVCEFVCLFKYLLYLPTSQYMFLSMSIRLSIYIFVYLCLSVSQDIYLLIRLSIYLSIYLFYVSVHPSIYISISL